MIEAPRGFEEIPKCPRWYISREGLLWSGKNSKMLSLGDNGTGYNQVIYRSNGARKKYYVHRLVAEVFLGEIPEGMCVNHKDGDKSNNHVNNLEIVTRAENNRHAIETGLNKRWRGETHPMAKLTCLDVLEIRERVLGGERKESLAVEFGVTGATISDVHRRVSWDWLDDRREAII